MLCMCQYPSPSHMYLYSDSCTFVCKKYIPAYLCMDTNILPQYTTHGLLRTCVCISATRTYEHVHACIHVHQPEYSYIYIYTLYTIHDELHLYFGVLTLF